MTPEQYQRVKDLFYRWCEAPATERSRVLDEGCDGDDAVRAEVEAMVRLDTADTGGDAGGGAAFLEKPAFGAGVIDEVIARRETTGGQPERIGDFTIVRRIGMGGMGVVYEAEQGHPRRTVALKVIRPGVASARTLRRFEFETQVLGRLQHPGIAQIFEAGTFDDGHGLQPYFAMELVRGAPLLDHARAQGLDVRARLGLVARIAAAVQHAHQQGVVHRDLKPDNILVQHDNGTGTGADGAAPTTSAGTGQPKILDFGVARMVDADAPAMTRQTDIGQLVGTIPYMSPEQARGRRDEVDQRTDVYALGVVAYELLAGRRPFDLGGLSVAEAVRTIEEEEPPSLGAIDRRLRGDVETIVAKALERDPARRYQSAAELAGDIERCLADQPIVARPPSAMYQIGKFARRNRAVFTGAVIAITALVLGFAITAVALVNALRSAEQARHEQEVARQVSAFLQDTLAELDPLTATSGAVRDLRDLLDTAAARALDELESAEVAAPVHLTIGSAYLTLAAYDDAEVHLQRARTLAAEAFGAESLEMAEVVDALGSLAAGRGEYGAARDMHVAALEMRRPLVGPVDARIGDSLVLLGHTQKVLGEYDEGERSLREALRIHEAAHGPDHRVVAQDLYELGSLLSDRFRLDEAAEAAGRSLEIRRRVFGDEHPYVASSLVSVGWVHRHAGRHAEAEEAYRHALRIRRATLEPDHPEIASGTSWLAAVIADQGRLDEAVPLYLDAIDLYERLDPGHPALGTTMHKLAVIYRRASRYEEAMAWDLRSLELFRSHYGSGHPNTGIILESIAMTCEEVGDFEAAEPYVQECVQLRRALLETGFPAWPLAMVESIEAMCAAARGRYEEAEATLLEAMKTVRAVTGDGDRRVRTVALRLMTMYEWWDRPSDAAVWADLAGR